MKTGIILANTGSPSSPEPDDIELYLREYLMDERIRQLPKPLWKWLLHKNILPKRKHTSAERYRFIWADEGSPLVANQRKLCAEVQALFDDEGRGIDAPGQEQMNVRCAMSYGHPSIYEELERLREWGAQRVVLLPLYPQSAYSPTLAVVDSFYRALDRMGWQPERHVIDNYHDDPAYIAAIVNAIKSVGYDKDAGDKLMLSLHAIPLKDERAGDGYRSQVKRSAALIAEGLGISGDDVCISYQSVFGHDKSAWVSPLSLDVLESWRNEPFRVVFACPGFAIDCLETLYDVPNEMVPALEGEGAKPTVDHVGKDIQAACNTSGRFVWVPTLNTSEEHARLVKGVIDKAL